MINAYPLNTTMLGQIYLYIRITIQLISKYLTYPSKHCQLVNLADTLPLSYTR